MEWVDRYLHQVEQYLPEAKREAVIEDLRDAIDGELEGLAVERGEAPREDDEKRVLARFGHPMVVAQRYHPLRYLIGPELYPSWWQTVRRVFAGVTGVGVVLALVLGATSGWRIGAFGLLGLILEMLLWSFVIVSAVYIAIERSEHRAGLHERWSPDRLPAGSRGAIERGDVVTNLFSEGVFLLWWNEVLVLTQWLPESVGAFPLQLGPAWELWFWPLNVIFGLAFALHLWVLLRGVWQRWTLGLEIATCLGVIVIALALLLTGDLITVRDLPSAEAMRLLGRGEVFIERTLNMVLAVIAGFTAWDLWKAVRRLN